MAVFGREPSLPFFEEWLSQEEEEEEEETEKQPLPPLSSSKTRQLGSGGCNSQGEAHTVVLFLRVSGGFVLKIRPRTRVRRERYGSKKSDTLTLLSLTTTRQKYSGAKKGVINSRFLFPGG